MLALTDLDPNLRSGRSNQVCPRKSESHLKKETDICGVSPVKYWVMNHFPKWDAQNLTCCESRDLHFTFKSRHGILAMIPPDSGPTFNPKSMIYINLWVFSFFNFPFLLKILYRDSQTWTRKFIPLTFLNGGGPQWHRFAIAVFVELRGSSRAAGCPQIAAPCLQCNMIFF